MLGLSGNNSDWLVEMIHCDPTYVVNPTCMFFIQIGQAQLSYISSPL